MLTVANVRRHPGSFGIRRPSRAVSLGDVREQPVQTMGLPQPGTDTDVWYYGGHGNPPIMQSSPGTEDYSGFAYQMELAWPEFAAAVEATAGTDDVNEWVATRPSDDPDAVEGAYGYPGFFEITADGKVREVAEPDRASGRNDPANPYWEELRGRLNPPEPVRDWGDEDSIMQGLSGEERALTGQTGGFMAAPSMASGPGGFSPPPQQLPNAGGFAPSPASSGPGGFARSPLPPFLNTIMAGGGQESLPEMSPEEIAREVQRKINREGLAGARRALEQGPSRVPDHLDDFVPDEDYGGVLEARRESSPLGWLGGRAAEWEGRQTYEPGPSKRAYPGAPLTPREPVGDPQSQRTQSMLADMFAQQGAGPEQRTGMVNQVWDSLQNTSWQQRAAMVSALVAAGLITTGTGGMGAPVGAGLLTAAGVGALSTAP